MDAIILATPRLIRFVSIRTKFPLSIPVYPVPCSTLRAIAALNF
jgi:hypothetical protein